MSFGSWHSKIRARKLLVKRQITIDLISYLAGILKSSNVKANTCIIGSFDHHFPDVLPLRAPDVSGIIQSRAATVISGPHIAVRAVWNGVRVSSRHFHIFIAVIVIKGDFLRQKSQHVHRSVLPRQECCSAFKQVNIPDSQHHRCCTISVGHVYIHADCLNMCAQKGRFSSWFTHD